MSPELIKYGVPRIVSPELPTVEAEADPFGQVLGEGELGIDGGFDTFTES